MNESPAHLPAATPQRTVESDFHIFLRSLNEACTRIIDRDYFQFSADGGDSSQERVYCYELYHQLRIALPEDFPCKLHGEVSKGTHPVIRRIFGGRRTPDFIIHIPRSMENNLVVMEVKPAQRSPSSLAADHEKLTKFVEEARYLRGILLTYSAGVQRVPRTVVQVSANSTGKVWVLWQPGPGQEPQLIRRQGTTAEYGSSH